MGKILYLLKPLGTLSCFYQPQGDHSMLGWAGLVVLRRDRCAVA